ncbi:MAG TPA: IclR family transcriptional regulator [Terriglobia bacterium]|nr:IclR family transcriptional regulator [Terriglobia bacterium]
MKRKPKEHSRKGREKNFVAVAQRLFSVLEALSQQRKSGVPLDELTQITGLAKTTVHRLLYSMVKLGYVDQDPVSSLYMLSGKFFELGTNALPYQRLTVLAKPLMQSLLLTFGESVNLAVPRGGVAIYILVQESPKAHRVAAQVGNYSYLHCTAVGKAIAAHISPNELEEALVCHGMPAMTPATITTRSRLQEELERVRSEGIAVDNEENIQGIICVGGPIFASDGKPIAALSISGPAIRMAQNVPTIKVALREAVQKISLLLGYPIIPAPSPTDLGIQVVAASR